MKSNIHVLAKNITEGILSGVKDKINDSRLINLKNMASVNYVPKTYTIGGANKQAKHIAGALSGNNSAHITPELRKNLDANAVQIARAKKAERLQSNIQRQDGKGIKGRAKTLVKGMQSNNRVLRSTSRLNAVKAAGAVGAVGVGGKMIKDTYDSVADN